MRRANIDQAMNHEWLSPLDYYQAGDVGLATVGNENASPPNRTRSDHGSYSSGSKVTRDSTVGDHGKPATPKALTRGKILSEEDSEQLKFQNPRTKRAQQEPVPTAKTSPESHRSSRQTKIIQQPQKPSTPSSRKSGNSKTSRYRTAMSGVTNLMHALGPKSGSSGHRSSRHAS